MNSMQRMLLRLQAAAARRMAAAAARLTSLPAGTLLSVFVMAMIPSHNKNTEQCGRVLLYAVPCIQHINEVSKLKEIIKQNSGLAMFVPKQAIQPEARYRWSDFVFPF